MIVQLYSCESVPNKVPEFVDPHITMEEEGFIIEVNPNHPSLMLVKDITELLKKNGFKNPELFYTGEKPKF